MNDLRQQVEELRQAVRARNDFIAIAAHELRNPMTPILAATELALAIARKTEACPERITTLLERLKLVVDDFIKRATRLLDVSRIEAGNLPLEFVATDLSALVLSVVPRYDAMATRMHSPIDLDTKGEVTGLWDRLAVEQIIENLLSNALKFGAGKPVSLRLHSNAEMAWLDVQDRGIGMPPDQQARIFGRFEQVMARHRSGGFGIGLWVANNLVTAMGGRISVSSSLGEGSTFTMTLPLKPAESDRIIQ